MGFHLQHMTFTMKKLIQITCVLLLLYSCKTQNYIKYHQIINEAEYSFYHGDYIAASKLYKKGFNKVKTPFEIDTYLYSASLWEIGEHDKSIALLDTVRGLEWALPKSGYFQGMDSITMKELISANKIKLNAIEKKRDSSKYITIMDSLWQIDQLARNTYNKYKSEFPYDTINLTLEWRKVDVCDSLNIEFLDSLIQKDGFIGGIKMPENPYIFGRFFIHHYDYVLSHKKEFIKAIKRGEVLPTEYATAYDKGIWFYKSPIDYYGCFQKNLDGVTPDIAFKRCEKIGLSPYYIKNVQLPRKKGNQPILHPNFDYYESRKSSFSCY